MPRIAIACLALLVFTLGCQPTVDGGWEGRAVCDDDTVVNVEAIFDQQTEDNELKGTFFLDLVINLGLLGTWETVQRGVIEDGEVDPQDGVFSGKLIANPEASGGNTVDYTFDLEWNDDEYTELTGDLDRVNADGEVVIRCDLDLDKAHDPQN
jgi:hypothetical protein